jgi:hypothetical protein
VKSTQLSSFIARERERDLVRWKISTSTNKFENGDRTSKEEEEAKASIATFAPVEISLGDSWRLLGDVVDGLLVH